LETFGALDGHHQAGLIYKDKEVHIDSNQLCVNNKRGIVVLKGWDEEWEILAIELFNGS